MTEKIGLSIHLINCPRFGGTRYAPTCIHFDRYKTCRRTCKSLQQHIVDNPAVTTVVEQYVEKKTQGGGNQLTLFADAKFSGQRLPNPQLTCKFCKFVARSERGLRIHYKRTHKVTAP